MPLALSRKTASGSGINFSDNICCAACFDCNKTQPNTPAKVTEYKNEALPPPPKGRRGTSLILYHTVLQKSIYAAKNRRHTSYTSADGWEGSLNCSCPQALNCPWGFKEHLIRTQKHTAHCCVPCVLVRMKGQVELYLFRKRNRYANMPAAYWPRGVSAKPYPRQNKSDTLSCVAFVLVRMKGLEPP